MTGKAFETADGGPTATLADPRTPPAPMDPALDRRRSAIEGGDAERATGPGIGPETETDADAGLDVEEIGARHGEVTGVWRILLVGVAIAVAALALVGALIGGA